MAIGTTFKRCTCRDPQTGRPLGKGCPKLYRRGGSWSPAHGTWAYQQELAPNADGGRRNPVRRGGFATQDDAVAEMSKLVELLAIGAEPADKVRISDLIVTALRQTKQPPALDEVRRSVRVGPGIDTSVTVGAYLEIWLAGKKGLSASTRRSYRGHIDLYLRPHLGHLRLDRLRVADIDVMFDLIEERNALITHARESGEAAARAKVKGGRVVNAATKQRIRATLRSALSKAIKEGRIDANPASLVELPSGRAPRALVWTEERVAAWRLGYAAHVTEREARKRRLSESEPDKRHGTRVTRLDAYVGTPRPSPVMVWTPEQTKTFLKRARKHRLYAQYHLITFRGLRRGESCGLSWSDLDLKRGTATIRWQITQLGSGTTQGTPKSDAGEAEISLDKTTVHELKAHRTRQAAERLAAGENWADTGLIFTTKTGEALHPAHVTEQFEHLSMEAGLPPIRLHDLRHGAASILLAAGYDMKVVQATLRLSSLAIAADTYTSLLPDLFAQSAEDAAAIIHNAGRPGVRNAS